MRFGLRPQSEPTTRPATRQSACCAAPMRRQSRFPYHATLPTTAAAATTQLQSRQPSLVKGAPRKRRGIGGISPGSRILRYTQNSGALAGSQRRQQKRRSRPISRVLSWTVIPLGAASPLRSSNLPGDTAGSGIVSLFGLAPGGVCRAGLLPDSRCALTAPFHPYHARLATPFGGLLSVALSVGLRRPGVTWHRALWSPDFPRHPAMQA